MMGEEDWASDEDAGEEDAEDPESEGEELEEVEEAVAADGLMSNKHGALFEFPEEGVWKQKAGTIHRASKEGLPEAACGFKFVMHSVTYHADGWPEGSWDLCGRSKCFES